jgi:Crinkler effector protein N-terminal domain
MMSDTITIICLVQGQSTQQAFAIDIDKTKLISHLKDRIKEKKQNDYCDIDADSLELWKVNIPSDDATIQELGGIAGKKLNDPTQDIGEIFKTPSKRHIHILVKCPTNKKEIHCKVTYGRNTAAFQWTPTRENTTLAELKIFLRGCFTFPDGTEDKDIVIGRDATRNKDGLLLCLLKDSELVSMVWNNGYQADLSLVVDTSQRAFSSWDFAKIRPLFGLAANSFSELPTFDGGYVDTTEFSDKMRHVLEDITV